MLPGPLPLVKAGEGPGDEATPTWADTFIAIVAQGSCNCLNYWGEPEQAHIDHDNGPIVCMYVVSLTHLFVVHLFLRSVHPLKCSVYSGILMWFMCEQQGPKLLIVCR